MDRAIRLLVPVYNLVLVSEIENEKVRRPAVHLKLFEASLLEEIQ